MTKEKILESLNGKNGKDAKTILEFCKTPRTGGEIMRCKTKNDVFVTLVELKKRNAISFENGKYFTTQLGIETLNSFPL